jgi:hypothetical protein
MATDAEKSDDFLDHYRKVLGEVDEFVQLVLNGHLSVEVGLDAFLEQVCFHASHLELAGLSFYQKVHIARAWAERDDDRGEWRVMLALNSLRNKMAHRSTRKNSEVRIDAIRNAVREAGSKKASEEISGMDDRAVVVYAAALCGAYLLVLRNQRIHGWKVDE